MARRRNENIIDNNMRLSKEELLELKLGKLEIREKELEFELKSKEQIIKSYEIKTLELQMKIQNMEAEKKISDAKTSMNIILEQVANLKKHVIDRQNEQIPLMKKIAKDHNISEEMKWGFDPLRGDIKIIDK